MRTLARIVCVSVILGEACFLWAAGPKDDFTFAQGLVRRGYYDLAEEQFRRIKKTPGRSAKDKGQASLGLAELLLKAAGAERREDKREQILARAAAACQEFIASNPSHPRAEAERIQLGTVQLERANILAAMFLNTDNKQAKAKLRSKAEPLFKAALAAFQAAARNIGSQFRSKADKARTSREKRALEPLKAEMLRAEIQIPWTRYFRSKLYPDNASVRKAALTAALSAFEKFAATYRNYLITLSAKRGAGLCLHYLGRYKDAAKRFHDVVRTRPSPESEEIRQLAYHDKTAACVAGRMYDDAIRTANAFFEEFEGADNTVAHAILVEQAKAFAGQARQQAALAKRYEKQKKKAEQSAAQSKAANLYKLALNTAMRVSSKGGKWGRSAADLMARWMKESGQMPKRGAPEAFASAEALFQEKKFLQAISEYQQTILFASAAEVKVAAQSWFKMAYAYYNLHRYYEAALCFSALAEKYPKHPLADDSAYFAVQLFGGLYGQSKKPDPNDGRRYLESLRALGHNFPHHPEANKVQFLAAEMERKNSVYRSAAEDYARISRASEFYETAAYLSGLCYWLEFVRQAEKNPRAPSLATLWRKAESQLSSFVQWWDELPRVTPKRVPRGKPWAARARVRLAAIYVDPAVRQPGKALLSLANFEKRFADQKSLLPEAFFLRLSALAQMGRLREAEAQFKTLDARYRTFDKIGRACRILGVAYSKQAAHKKKVNDQKGVSASLAKAAYYLALMVKRQPNLPLVDYTWAGTALYKLAKYANAAAIFEAALKRFGAKDTEPVWDTRRRLAECYLAMHDWKRALTLYEKLVEREPRVIDYRREIARCYEETGDYDNALPNWRIVATQAREETGEWYSAKYHLIYNHCKKKDYDRAYAILSLMLDLHPALGGKTTQTRFDGLVKKEFPKPYQKRYAQLKQSVVKGLQP